MADSLLRCTWCGNDELMIAYHDTEWGVPKHDDRMHFEHLCLEGAQAGLSWLTVLRKRENYNKAFTGFDPKRVSTYGPRDIERLLGDAGIIRNRQKIESAINNAGRFIEIQKEFGSFATYLWGFVKNKTVQNKWKSLDEIPAKTELSERISRDLKKRGFKFVGPTTIYAHLQSTGLINDHLTSCFRYKDLSK